MIRNLIFDFDRTLFDSYPHIAAALCAILRKYGIAHDPAEVMEALFISFWHASEKYGLTREQTAEFIALNADHGFAPPVVPYEGVPEMLRAFREAGLRMFVYSHSTTEKVNYYYEKYGMTALFEESVTSDYGFAPKPSPAGVAYLLEKYALVPAETLMVGDRALDIMAGVNAGVPGCLIQWGTEAQTDRATYYIEEIGELPGIVWGGEADAHSEK